MDATTFAERLRTLRKQSGLSQHQLAEKSGVTRSAIAKFELGEREPLLATAQKLAAALGVDCTAFSDQAGKPSEPAPEATPTKPAKKKKGKGA